MPHLVGDRQPYANQDHNHRSKGKRFPCCNPYNNLGDRGSGQCSVQNIAADPGRQAAEKKGPSQNDPYTSTAIASSSNGVINPGLDSLILFHEFRYGQREGWPTPNSSTPTRPPQRLILPTPCAWTHRGGVRRVAAAQRPVLVIRLGTSLESPPSRDSNHPVSDRCGPCLAGG